jgi:hypothetical protein
LGSLDGGAYYLNAPSMLGVAFTQLDGVYNQTAYMNLSAGGVDNQLTLYYTSPVAISNAVTAYSGLNGTGSVLGTLDFAATDPAYSQWKKATLTFSGTALSFDFSATAYQSPDAPGAGIDNIAAIPEPETYAMLLAGLGLIGAAVKRQKAKQA